MSCNNKTSKMAAASALVLAAIAGVASAQAGSQDVLMNPSSGQCLVTSSYDPSRNEYGLTLGQCSRGVTFTYTSTGGWLQTPDGLCLSTIQNKSKPGSAVGLAACKSKEGKMWTYMPGTNQWRNGFGLCLDFAGGSMVQSQCGMGYTPFQQYRLGGGYNPNPPPSPPKPPCPPPPPQPTPPPQPRCDPPSGQWAYHKGGTRPCCGLGGAFVWDLYDSTCTPGSCGSQCCQGIPAPVPDPPAPAPGPDPDGPIVY